MVGFPDTSPEQIFDVARRHRGVGCVPWVKSRDLGHRWSNGVAGVSGRTAVMLLREHESST